MRRRNKEETRKKIVRSATAEFIKKGFLEASTLEIARRASVAHATVFFHFPTKTDLIVNCLYYKMGPLASKLDKKSRMACKVEDLCEIFLVEVDKNSRFYSRLVKDLPLLPLKVQRMVFASLSGFSVHFVDVIEKMQKKGEFRKFPPRIAVFFWFGVVNYLYSYEKLLGVKKLGRKERREIIRFFINGLIAR